MLKADLHVHTKYSLDCNTELEDIIAQCQRKSINCIAISDHGTIEGALKLKEIAPFKVIVAEEVLTPHGEIMGMFLKEGIKSGQSVEAVVSRIKAQGGLVCLPHPFDILRPTSALKEHKIEEIAGQVDIVEVFNSKAILRASATKARHLAEKHGLAQSAGSDAHTAAQIGRAYVEMPEFDGKDDFLAALASGKIFGHKITPALYLRGAWARLRKGLNSK
ncbi:MAG: PHP domain-containing protein [Chloroflexi bacterium]|nr:PHP domain-containing protein [Chloroflexota bacterium]